MRSAPGLRRATSIVAGLLVVASFMVAIPAGVMAAEVLCGGESIDFLGTRGDDVITGTAGPDVIHGLGGNDTIYGLDGADIICGGDGNDEVRGGGHGDTIFGGGGADLLYGQAGVDSVFGGKGNDTIFGGTGPDLLAGKRGADRIKGGPGVDTIYGNQDDDTLLGGSTDDELDGGGGADRCAGSTETDCELEVIDYVFERFLINQAVPQADSAQPSAQRIGTVEQRAGIVRVFISANQPGIPSPPVHLFYKKNGQKTRLSMTGPATVPIDPQESDLTTTYNYTFDETLLEPGTKMRVQVDRLNATFELDEDNNRYPASGWSNIDTRNVPEMKITVVPITIEGGAAASISQSQAEALLAKTLKVHPIGTYDIEVRANYLFENPTGTSDDWSTLLVEMADLRAAENPDRQYHAFLPHGLSPGIGGIGFVGLPAAVSIQNAETIAHETGHNLNLPHNPCSGDESNPDPDYPYAGGKIGTWGYDISTGAAYGPEGYFDLMTYCGPEWVSDYTFDKVLEYRSGAYGWEADGPEPQPAEAGRVLEFSGFVPSNAHQAANQSAEIALDATAVISRIETVDHPAAPPAPGEHTMVGRDAAGEVVAAVSFQSFAIDHADGAFFIFSMGLAQAKIDRISSWTVEKAGRVIAAAPVG